MQGGHYWNQINGRYAPFVSANAIAGLPHMQNYLLASARYGHGEGGAGRRGSREVYGGHSHVGTMIYLGDNWPDEYRNHLFSHNLHGHQLNQQVNVRDAGGFNTVHAGQDVMFCADQQYIGVDLKYGPDGAVYISDWYDPRHCHNPNVELWDRGNGRMYRMKFDQTYQPVQVDYSSASEDELVAAQLHKNDWHVRAARLVLAVRAANDELSDSVTNKLREMATAHPEETRRLRALWALHVTNRLDLALVEKLLDDPSEHIRAWSVQLALESLDHNQFGDRLVQLAKEDESLLVRRYLASAVQKLPDAYGWKIAETLSSQSENTSDRDLPNLLWFSIAQLMERDLERGLAIAGTTRIPELQDYVLWYAAKSSDFGREHLLNLMQDGTDQQQGWLLSLMGLGLRGMRGIDEPAGWEGVAAKLYESPNQSIRQSAESVGAAFGDQQLYLRMRDVLKREASSLPEKRHAISILAADNSQDNLPIPHETCRQLSTHAAGSSAAGEVQRRFDRRSAHRASGRLVRRNSFSSDASADQSHELVTSLAGRDRKRKNREVATHCVLCETDVCVG